MDVRSSGMRRVVRLRDGDSERGSGRRGRLQGHNLTVEVRAIIEEGKSSIRLYFLKYKPYILGLHTT